MNTVESARGHWSGDYRSYDVLREIVAAVVLVALATVALALIFESPQREAVTFQEWASRDPAGFLATTLDEMSGASGTAQYGPPYNDTPDAAQSLFGLSPQSWVGVRIPVDTAENLVLQPLGTLGSSGSDLAAAVGAYRAATAAQQQAWVGAYGTALRSATVSGPTVDVPAGDYGPVGVMMESMLALARSGAVDGALIDDRPGRPGFFVMDYTRSQLYLADGDYLANLGGENGLAGDQWGMAATLGNWPGQVWLLPVSFWYQIPPASTSGNGDLIVIAIVTLLGVVLVFLPWIPGLRAIPERLGVYRLIWRRYYESRR